MKLKETTDKWLLIGLGNIGDEYSGTRHNFGFLAIDHFSDNRKKSKNWRSRLKYDYCILSEDYIICARPRTFMNHSGIAVAALIKKFKINPQRTIIFFDDIDIPSGRLRLRWSGGDGGHKGIKSIIESINSEDFIRIRLGIGKPDKNDIIEYVLSQFTEAEMKVVAKMLHESTKIAEAVINGAIKKGSNRTVDVS